MANTHLPYRKPEGFYLITTSHRFKSVRSSTGDSYIQLRLSKEKKEHISPQFLQLHVSLGPSAHCWPCLEPGARPDYLHSPFHSVSCCEWVYKWKSFSFASHHIFQWLQRCFWITLEHLRVKNTELHILLVAELLCMNPVIKTTQCAFIFAELYL